jgi:hypothetical protein
MGVFLKILKLTRYAEVIFPIGAPGIENDMLGAMAISARHRYSFGASSDGSMPSALASFRMVER